MKEMICIVCPKGCHLLAKEGTVTGNACPRGEAYAITELTAPVRMLTTTVLLENGEYPRLPVKTSKPVPKGMLFEVMEVLGKVRARSPVSVGDVLISDILGTGADIVACRTM